MRRRRRWFNQLDPNLNKRPFTDREEAVVRAPLLLAPSIFWLDGGAMVRPAPAAWLGVVSGQYGTYDTPPVDRAMSCADRTPSGGAIESAFESAESADGMWAVVGAQVITAQAELGNKWSAIAKLLPGRCVPLPALVATARVGGNRIPNWIRIHAGRERS